MNYFLFTYDKNISVNALGALLVRYLSLQLMNSFMKMKTEAAIYPQTSYASLGLSVLLD